MTKFKKSYLPTVVKHQLYTMSIHKNSGGYDRNRYGRNEDLRTDHGGSRIPHTTHSTPQTNVGRMA